MAMYTIGQIANIFGISRDKLRYYEEKGILKPTQNDENNYRQYDDKDIDTVLAIEFYRSLDLDFKTIKKLHKQSNMNDIECILDEKHNEVMKEIDRLNTIANRIDSAKRGCNDIQKYLNEFTIRPMAPIKILGEISDYRSYNEFEIIHENRNELDETSIMKSLKKYITCTEKGIESTKMFVTKDIDCDNNVVDDDILQYEKCVYTIVQDGIHNKNVMEETYLKSLEWIYSKGYRHKGIAILSMLLMVYDEGMGKSYLEVYIPIE